MTVEEADIDFNNNLILNINGENGSGKSTILYAIACCLNSYKLGDSLRDYVRTNSEEDTSHLVLDGLLNNEDLHIELDIYGNTPEGKKHSPTKRTTIYKGTTYLNSDHDQFVLTYNIDSLVDTMFLFQNSTRDIIDAKPLERADFLKKMFKFEFPEIVNKFKEAQEQSKIENLETSTLITELNSRTFETQGLLRESSKESIDGWKDRLVEVSKSLSQVNNIDESKLKSCEDELGKVQKELINLNSKVEEDKASIESKKNTLREIESQLKIQSIKEEETLLQKTQDRLIEHQKNYETTREEVNALTKSLSVKNYELEELIKQLEISRTGVCHACGNTITEGHVKKLESNKDKVDKEASDLRNQIASINFDPRDVESSRLNKEIKEIENKINKIKENERLRETLVNQIKDNEELLKERSSRINELTDQRTKLTNELNALNELKPLIKQREDLLSEQKDLESKINEAKETSIRNAEKRESNKLIEAERKKTEDKLAKLNEKINKIALDMTSTKTCIDIFENQFPAYLVLQATQSLEDFINEIVQKVFPTCRVSLKQTGKGVAFYYTPDSTEEWLPVKMASGAQKQILALSYRIALAKLAGISCICLDEIDSALSAGNSEIVYEFVAGIDYFDQVLFVTHRQEAIDIAKEVNSLMTTCTVENGEYFFQEN